MILIYIMGQVKSTDIFSNIIGNVPNEIYKQARNVTEITLISYDDFLKRVTELNSLCQKLNLPGGQKFCFYIKKGSDCSILWKGTVKIGWILFDTETKSVIYNRLINLSTFLKIFRSIQNEVQPANIGIDNVNIQQTSLNLPTNKLVQKLSDIFSVDLENSDGISPECCICLERKPDILLPCSHPYCQQCILEWNTDHNTCPMCRAVTENTNDCWVLPEAPKNDEIAEYITSYLMHLAD